VYLGGKNILITGGASGIGRALVERLVAEDVNIGVLDLDREGLERLSAAHPRVHCSICDVGDPMEVKNAVDDFARKNATIHVLVNNAGFIFNSPLVGFGKAGVETHSIEMWDKVIRTDLSSVFYVTSQVVQLMMLKRTKGVIINIGSVSAAGNIGQSAYSAAKAGVNALTVSWAKELSPLGIRFVGIAPGFTKTETTLRSVAENVLKSFVKQTPMRRLGDPEEIVEAIVFAIHNEFMNGKIIEIDGGLRI
jgi:3-oxoacyl-[acyl-carrier protein] reductase